jgi:hypothetical protein
MLRDADLMLVDDAWRQYFVDLSRAIQNLRDGSNGVTPKWTSGDSYVVDDIVWSPANQLQYVCTGATSGSIDPSSDPDNWQLFGASKVRQILRGWAVIPSGASTLTVALSPAVYNTAKAEVRLLGFYSSAASSLEPYDGSVLLASDTALTFNRTSTAAFSTTLHWEITEWW